VYALLSKKFSGSLITTKWRNPQEDRSHETIRLRASTMSRFTYHPVPIPRILRPVKYFYFLLAFVAVALFLHHRRQKFDVVVTYGPYTTAFAGYLLKLLLGIKFIMDIPGDPFAGHKYSRPQPGTMARLKIRLGKIIIPFMFKRADHLKLLYRGQLQNLINESEMEVSYFADYTAVSDIRPSVPREKFLLFVGHPWYLKGVDLLIPAFLEVADRFPGYQLRIVGWCTNREPFERLAAGDPRVQFSNPLPNEVVKQWMSQCAAFVLASRTEGIPRVLLEAMAAKAPIVASRVGGIPVLLPDEKYGLLFESGNQADLARALDKMLGDASRREQTAEAAYERLQQNYLEEHYLEHYVRMIGSVCGS